MTETAGLRRKKVENVGRLPIVGVINLVDLKRLLRKLVVLNATNTYVTQCNSNISKCC